MNANIHSDNEDKGYKNPHNQRKRYTQFSSEKLFSSWILLQYISIKSHSNLIIEGCLANATLAYPYFSISFSFLVRLWMNPTLLSICIDKKRRTVPKAIKPEKNSTNRFISGQRRRLRPSILTRSSYWRFFASSVWLCLWERLQSHTVSLFMTKEFLSITDGFHSTTNLQDLTSAVLKPSINIDKD